MNRPNRRQVLECGGWWGTGLTPLLELMPRVQAIAVCAVAPHPPHSQTLPRDAVLPAGCRQHAEPGEGTDNRVVFGLGLALTLGAPNFTVATA